MSADTLTLFDDDSARGVTRRRDPETSRASAAGISKDTKREVLEVFRTTPAGLTDDELCARLPDRYPPTVKTARSQLTKAGELVATQRRRLSQRRRSQIVWVHAAHAGREAS